MDFNIVFVLVFLFSEPATSCLGITGNTTAIYGDNFEVLCNTTFGSEQVYSIVYKESFEDCISACANLEASVECAGVQYSPGTAAPEGLSGSLCYIQWAMNGSGTPSNSYHSARFEPPVVSKVC